MGLWSRMWKCQGRNVLPEFICILFIFVIALSLEVVSGNTRPCWCQDGPTTEEPLYQIVGIAPNRSMVLQNVDLFTNTLKSPAVANKKVAIVGIVGKYRGGKSTLLNIINRYLLCLPKNASNQEMSMDSWLYEREDFPACRNVFGTASTSKGFTKGIWITRHPIILPDDKGEEVAVFLIDTQGMMDNINNQAAESPLFYLTSMLSSTLIVNTMNVLDRQLTDLVGSLTLQVTDAVARENLEDTGKVLQRLVFLVRDWNLEHEYGWNGGKQYLQEYFETDQERSAGVARELETGYDNVSCFLMPNIAYNTKHLKLTASRLTPDFGPECELFLDSLFKANHITPKKIFGRAVNGTQFSPHVQLFANMFRNGTLQSVGDVYSQQVDLLVQEKLTNIIALYRENMQAFLTDLEDISDMDLHNIHTYYYMQALVALRNTSILSRKQVTLDRAAGVFNKTTRALYAEFARQQLEKRTALMERLLGVARASIQLAKQNYRIGMEQDISENFYNIPELMERHTKWKNTMREMFLDNNTEITRKPEVYNETRFVYDAAIDACVDEYVRKIMQEEEEMNAAIIDAEGEYGRIMDQSLPEFPLPEYVLLEKSDLATRSVRNRFVNSRLIKSKPMTIPYHEEMLDVVLQNDSRKYFDNNQQKTESLRETIPGLTATLERFGTALLTTGFPAMAFTGDPLFTTASGVISAITQIIKIITLLSNSERPDPKFQRMIQEFTILNDRLSMVEAKIVQYSTMLPVKEEYREHLQAMSNIKNKVNAMTQNANNATRKEFLRVCEQHDPSNILNWLRDRVSGQYGNILGYFLSDIVQGVEYNRTAYGLWMQSIMALDTQAVMYRLMYMQLSGQFDNTTIVLQADYMKAQVRTIYDSLKAMDTQLKATYPSQQLQNDIRSQLLLYKLQGTSSDRAAKKLKEFLSNKYSWVDWMVSLHVHTCNTEFYRAVSIKNPLDAMSGIKSGIMFVPSIADWNAVVAWKSEDELRATPDYAREMTKLQRDINWYSQQDRWDPTLVRGIRDAGKFMENFLKPELSYGNKVEWSGLMVVKKECSFVMEPSVGVSRFFNVVNEGYECTFSKMPFVCGWIVLSGEAHVVLFPATGPVAMNSVEGSVMIHPLINIV